MMRVHAQRGSTLLEAILALSVIAMLMVIFVGSMTYAAQSSHLELKRTQATLLAEEGLEAVRNIRDADFSLLTDGAHGLSLSGNIWNFSGTEEVLDAFTRVITIESPDADTRRIISTVTWANGNNTYTVSFETQVTDWRT